MININRHVIKNEGLGGKQDLFKYLALKPVLLALFFGAASSLLLAAEPTQLNKAGVKSTHPSVEPVGLNANEIINAQTSAESQLVLLGSLTQGALIRGKLPSGSEVWLNGKALEILENGNFVFGFGRDAQLNNTLEWKLARQSQTLEEISTKANERHSQTIVLSKREYNVQRIEGVAAKYVSPPKEVLARIRSDNKQISAARSTSSSLASFTGSFILPADGPISGVYGSRRIFNGEPKRPHYGLDIAGPVGTPIIAPVDGVVTLAHDDMYYSGGTLIIDHGLGVSSTFIHLSSIDVQKGDRIIKGQKIGEMGATGRVTGPHLDWRINWFSERLDPALLVDLTQLEN